jgi:molybdopterin synthase sulfur carrier subunit
MTIITFGQIIDLVGSNQLIVENIKDTDQLQLFLSKKYPGLAELQYRIAVDKDIIIKNTNLNNAAIVALLPPFSGG